MKDHAFKRGIGASAQPIQKFPLPSPCLNPCHLLPCFSAHKGALALLGSRLSSTTLLLRAPLCCGTAFCNPVAESFLVSLPSPADFLFSPPAPLPTASLPFFLFNLSNSLSYGFLPIAQTASYSSSNRTASSVALTCGSKGACAMESEGGGGGFGGSGYVVRLKSREATRWACASSFWAGVRSAVVVAFWVGAEGRVARVCCAVERMLVLRWWVSGFWFGNCEGWSIHGLLHGSLLRSEVLEDVA